MGKWFAAQFSNGVTVEVVSSVQTIRYERFELFGEDGFAVGNGTFGREGSGEILINDQPMQFESANPFVDQLKNVCARVNAHGSFRADENVGIRALKDLLLASDV